MKKLVLLSCLVGSATAYGQSYFPQMGVPLKNLRPGAPRAIVGAVELSPYPVDNKLVFVSAEVNPATLYFWKTDGSDTGSYKVSPGKDYRTGAVEGGKFYSINGNSFHSAYLHANYSNGEPRAIVRTRIDGTPADSLTDSYLNLGDFTAVVGNTTYFIRGFDLAGLTNWLYKTDGTVAGTQKVALPNPNVNLRRARMYELNGKLLFEDASASGFFSLDLGTGALTRYPHDGYLLGKTSNKIFFYASVGNGWTLMATNGNTNQVDTLKSFGGWQRPESRLAGAANDKLIFSVKSASNIPDPDELWSSDGTVAGTQKIYAATGWRPVSTYAAERYFSLDMGGFAIFIGNDTAGKELWRTDGTTAGTFRISNVNTPKISGGDVDAADLSPKNIIDGYFYFSGIMPGSAGRPLLVTDGTVAGTQVAMRVDTAVGYSANSGFSIAKYNNRIYVILNQRSFANGDVYSFPAPPALPTAVAPLQNKGAALKAYPNPVTHHLHIEGCQETDRVQVIALGTGQLLGEKTITQGCVDFLEVPPGFYLLRVLRNQQLIGVLKVQK